MTRGVARLLVGKKKPGKAADASPQTGHDVEAPRLPSFSPAAGAYESVDSSGTCSDRGNNSNKSGGRFHMPSFHAPNKMAAPSISARKMATAFKKKIRSKVGKTMENNSELLAVAEEDNMDVAWFEDSSDEGTTEDVEISPDAEGASQRSRSLECSDDADSGNEDHRALSSSCDSALRSSREASKDLEAGGSSTTNAEDGDETTGLRPQVYGASQCGDSSGSKPPRQAKSEKGKSEKAKSVKAKSQQQVTWDAKRFKGVKPLQCTSIWDIPTSKDPFPEVRPVRHEPPDPAPRPVTQSSKAGSKAAEPKSFGSADVFREDAQEEIVWHRDVRIRVMLLAAVVIAVTGISWKMAYG